MTNEPGPRSPGPTGLTGRSEARERALHLLYEAEIKGGDVQGVLAAQVVTPDPYAVRLVEGVSRRRADIDEVINRRAEGWSTDRMATLDLTVLRLGTYELMEATDVPRGVVLSEATELASRYASRDDTSRFVNGLLAAVADEVRYVPDEGDTDADR